MARVWQIAGGPWARSYSDLFLRHGVGLIGPGDPGAWTAARPDTDFGGSSVRRFATHAQEGDIVLLRAGNSVVRAVGLIASDYQYLPQFDDVNGWDLQHGRRVRWCPLPQAHDFGQAVFGANPRRFGKVDRAEVVDFAQRFVNSEQATNWKTAPLPPLPEEEQPLEEIPERLREVVGLAHDFAQQNFGERVSEDEMIVHMIAPLFRALGWLPEQIAVKWRYVDVALFPKLPRIPENCGLIIEAKYPGAGAEGALGQAQRYARELNIRKDVLVTDGFRYRLYAVEQDYEPVAYANLLRLKRKSLDLFDRLKRPQRSE